MKGEGEVGEVGSGGVWGTLWTVKRFEGHCEASLYD